MLKLSEKCSWRLKSFSKVRFEAIRTYSTNENKVKSSGLDSGYLPGVVEANETGFGYFEPKITAEKPFSIILPPPNVTGVLHLGHALTATIQDVIVRWKRMQGVETLWVPGLDHAGIATQVVVEKQLLKETGKSRHEIGRENFEREVWNWKEDKCKVIGSQLKRLGVSLDWDREMFTMDPAQNRAVTAAFIKLFDAGLIYRGDHLVNWSCVLQSAISDIEVEHLQVDGPTSVTVPGYDKSVHFGTLTHFAYKFHESEEELVVATTRPETMVGDVAVAVNPHDDRYAAHIGRNLWHPFRKQTIPVICDDFVDPEFGTGAVKLTPAHDRDDFAVAKKHGLPLLQVIDEKGTLTPNCGKFAGKRRFDARDAVLEELGRLGLLRGRQDHRMLVPICARSRDVVEFLLKPQWFVKCAGMAQRAVGEVRGGRLCIEPSHYEKIWFGYLEDVRDWCVSRQLWWGHRIPAYLCRGEFGSKWVAAGDAEEARSKASSLFSGDPDSIEVVRQDEDVLDTWFSSGILPFSAFGWPQQGSGDLDRYYPLSMMETGHDILFFWVARMVMLGLELTGRLPFDKILLHGIICDSQGRKMSKSVGNVIAPEHVISGSSLESLESESKASYDSGVLSADELGRAIQGQKKMFPEGIPECGSDALRFTLCSHNIKNRFINFNVQECHTNKLFGNKIWQACKYANSCIEKIDRPGEKPNLQPMDKWIMSRLSNLVKVSTESLGNYDLHVVTAAIKNFLYYEFCDIYLETTKRGLKVADSEIAAGHCWALAKSLDVGLRVLAPFMPRLAQHLHQHLERFPGEDQPLDFPQDPNWHNEELEKRVERVMELVVAIRRLKKIFNVTTKHNPEVYVITDLDFGEFKYPIEDLSVCTQINFSRELAPDLRRKGVTDNLGDSMQVHLIVPLELKKALDMDAPKLDGQRKKILKELDKMEKMISGDNYKIKATPESQEVHAKKVDTLRGKLDRIHYIESLLNQ